MELINENTTRKIDNLGRIGIPKGIRNRLRFQPEQEMEFFTLRLDGKEYVAFAPVGGEDTRYAQAAELLTELGVEIPDELAAHL